MKIGIVVIAIIVIVNVNTSLVVIVVAGRVTATIQSCIDPLLLLPLPVRPYYDPQGGVSSTPLRLDWLGLA